MPYWTAGSGDMLRRDTTDRLGRPAPIKSRVLAHDALDALAALAGDA